MDSKRQRPGSVFIRALKDRSGAIAPMFGVMFGLVIVPMVGMGIDLSRAVTSRSSLQDALDATALALSKMPINTAHADLQAAADKWMAANLNDNNLTTPVVTVKETYAKSDNPTNTIELTATTSVKTTIAAVVGIDQLPLSAKSATYWGMQHVELALVLDNTGSMLESDGSGGTKSASLKTAANDLIDTLSAQAQAAADPQAFKVGMVPFATYVNVGVANKGAWITGTSPYANDLFYNSTTGASVPTDRFALFTSMGQSWGGCVESRPMPYDIQDTAPSSSVPNTMFVPYFAPDEPDDTFNGRDLYYNDYVADGLPSSTNWKLRQGNPLKYAGKTPRQQQPWYFSNGGIDSGAGPNHDCPNVPLIRMTTNFTAVKAAINALAPAGNTHIPFGLVWGWHLVSPKLPFGDGVAYGTKNVIKVVVLVTDGNNTYWAGSADPSTYVNNGVSYDSKGNASWATTNNSVPTGYGYVWQNRISQDGGSFADPAKAMDDRLKKLCSNMQAAGVILYTVPLLVTDVNTKTLLKACASNDKNYLEARSKDDLTKAFQTIATSISALRLSK